MPFLRVAATVLLLSAAASVPLEAQGIGSRLRNRVNQAVDKAIDKAADRVEGAISCKVSDSACISRAEQAGKPVVVTDASGAPLPQDRQDAARQAATRPGQGAWANFDFVPGERVLRAEDFSGDRVGNFPRGMEFIHGAAEIVESGGKRYLSSSGYTDLYALKLPENLPERFTIEWDWTLPQDWENHVFFAREGVEAGRHAANGGHIPTGSVFLSGYKAGAKRGGGEAASERELGSIVIDPNNRAGQLVRMRLHVDGRYVKVYVNEVRVANIPNLDLPRGNMIYFNPSGRAEAPVLIGNISVNAGGRTMYDALSADGRVATQGIYFDTGSDRIRPESSGTLSEIADMLKQHADLRLTIEGHTDNVGDAAANQGLSEKRATAVKAALVSSYGIDGARLNAVGLGQTKPAAPNDTPEGRQTNRRVELVKQ